MEEGEAGGTKEELEWKMEMGEGLKRKRVGQEREKES